MIPAANRGRGGRSSGSGIRHGAHAVLPPIRFDRTPNLACHRRGIRGRAGGNGSRLATRVLHPSLARVFVGPPLLPHFISIPSCEEHHQLSHYETELEEMIHLKAGIHSTLEVFLQYCRFNMPAPSSPQGAKLHCSRPSHPGSDRLPKRNLKRIFMTA